jgi:ribose transport system ATP-binding protein
MVGRELTDDYPQRTRQLGPVALRVAGLSRGGLFHDVAFDVREGEILGICCLAGSGRTEILRAIVGADRADHGNCQLYGRDADIRSPGQAIRLGMGLVPEDRKLQGLFLQHPVVFNITIARPKDFILGGLIRPARENDAVRKFVDAPQIKTSSIFATMRNLSGGNQQKCAVATKLNAKCRILLVDEPTRGVDVGAKREIYQVMVDLEDRQRTAIVMVSSELPEILGMSDRILVVKTGAIVAEFSRDEASEEAIMQCAV